MLVWIARSLHVNKSLKDEKRTIFSWPALWRIRRVFGGIRPVWSRSILIIGCIIFYSWRQRLIRRLEKLIGTTPGAAIVDSSFLCLLFILYKLYNLILFFLFISLQQRIIYILWVREPMSWRGSRPRGRRIALIYDGILAAKKEEHITTAATAYRRRMRPGEREKKQKTKGSEGRKFPRTRYVVSTLGLFSLS